MHPLFRGEIGYFHLGGALSPSKVLCDFFFKDIISCLNLQIYETCTYKCVGTYEEHMCACVLAGIYFASIHVCLWKCH